MSSVAKMQFLKYIGDKKELANTNMSSERG
jgi:hypothetical protein